LRPLEQWLSLVCSGCTRHVTVEYLADRREFIPTVARWLHAEWGHLRPGETVEDRAARVERDCGHCQVPTTFVALAGDQLVGSASLVEHDMATRPELSPWLSDVFVAPEHRRRGVGGPWLSESFWRRASFARRVFIFTRLVPALCILGWGGRLWSARFTASYGESKRSRLWNLPLMPPKHMIQLTLNAFARHGRQAVQVRRPVATTSLNL